MATSRCAGQPIGEQMRSGTRRRTAVPADLGGQAPDPRFGRGRRLRRAILPAALVMLAVAGLLALSLVGSMRSVRENLLRGRSAMERGRDELIAGDATAALATFRAGRQLFAQAEDRANGLVVRAVGWLPIIGRTSDAVSALSESASIAADATIVLADAVAEIPGGPTGLAPSGGRIVVDRFGPLARAARDGRRAHAACGLAPE